MLLTFFFSNSNQIPYLDFPPHQEERGFKIIHGQEPRRKSTLKPPLSNYPFLKHKVPFF